MNSELILNNLNTAVIVIDDKLIAHYANPAATQLFAIGSHKLVEQPILEHCQLLGVDTQLLSQSIADNQGLTVNTTDLITLTGQHHTIDLTLTPFDTERHLGLLELRQVDQQRRIHQQLNLDAQQQAAQFLVRNLAHEIKNPLGGLRGAAQLLARELNEPQLKEFTTLIIEQADRLSALVNRLLGPQRPTRHTKHNIHQVIQKVIQLTEMTCPSNIQILQDYDPSIPDIDMDADQMLQALLNIVQNAIQALALQGGNIRIKTRTQNQVTIGQQRHRVVMTVAVIDDGPGVPEELLDTLFYPMVTGKPEGSGLGLSIAHNIARLHGGRIDCVSAAGHTEFTLTLPIKI